jgi:hypothetical protein
MPMVAELGIKFIAFNAVGNLLHFHYSPLLGPTPSPYPYRLFLTPILYCILIHVYVPQVVFSPQFLTKLI